MRVIAECGCNWRNLDEAMEMIHKAKDAGCWAAKFQLFSEEYAKQSNLPLCLSLRINEASELFELGRALEFEVFFTPFDVERVAWCKEIGCRYIKVRFKDNHNIPLLKEIIKYYKPENIFISSNYFHSKEIVKANYLYCIPDYPANYVGYLFSHHAEAFSGISDHTPDLTLFKLYKAHVDNEYAVIFFYFEKHVKLDDDCIESAWSVTFEQLKEVLKP